MPTPDVTRLLHEISARPAAAAELLPLVYDELRALARSRLRHESPGHTLQATALVHEAYVRLVGGNEPDWRDRAHFFRAAAESMRRILVDHARARLAVKRGGGRPRTALEAADVAAHDAPEAFLALDAALERLAAEDPRAAEIVALRFHAGLEVADVARLLDCSERTVLRDWAFARARLAELVEAEDATP